jgi:hypothetical protein
MTMEISEILDKIEDAKARKKTVDYEISLFDDSITSANVHSGRLSVEGLKAGWERVLAAKSVSTPFQKKIDEINAELFYLRAKLPKDPKKKKKRAIKREWWA